jgi:cytochrome c peroxidase
LALYRSTSAFGHRSTGPAALLLAGALLALAGCGGSPGAEPAAPGGDDLSRSSAPPNAAAPAPAPGPAPAPAPAPGPAPAPAPDPAAWTWTLPAGWLVPKVPEANPMGNAKVELGRHLFYDDRLSGNEQMSCATCHKQSLGFGDARATPFGSTGQVLPRNAQPLANLAWFDALNWAGAPGDTLERQMETPLFGTMPVEMGVNDGNRDAVLARIAGADLYRRLFGAAFPAEGQPVTWDNAIAAIASFQRSLVSAGSRFDRAERGEATLDASEQRGRDLFFSDRAGCSACHGGNTFAEPTAARGVPVATAFHNIGLYSIGNSGAYPAPNRGLYERTLDPADMGRFRAPSLRNVEFTGPYMHDGSVTTLAEAIAIHADGGRDVPTGPNAGDGRASPYRSPLLAPVALDAAERADLLAFLRTLTDPTFLSDPRHANPFAPR